MKIKIYIETSVISYLTARLSRNIIIAGHQAITQDFWKTLNLYDAYISELVVLEISCGDRKAAKTRLNAITNLDELEINNECKILAKQLIKSNAIPKQFPEDALHIAIAAYHKVDAIITWNFKHLNNPIARSKIREALEKIGYNCPEICSPEIFLGGKYNV